jgi:hypothetical protein
MGCMLLCDCSQIDIPLTESQIVNNSFGEATYITLRALDLTISCIMLTELAWSFPRSQIDGLVFRQMESLVEGRDD